MLFQTASHPVFQLLVQTAHACFCGRKWVHTRLRQQDRTQGHTRRNRGLPSLVHSVVLCCRRYPFYSAMLLYTYISRFSVNPQHQQKRIIGQSCRHKFYPPTVFHPAFQLLAQMAHVCFHGRKLVHARLCQQDRTQRPTRRNRGRFRWGVSLPSERSTRFGNPAWPGIRTAYFAAFGSWPGVRQKDAESLRDSDALMRVAVPQASRPRWAA